MVFRWGAGLGMGRWIIGSSVKSELELVGTAPVGVIDEVVGFGAELNAVAFVDDDAFVHGQVRSRDRFAAEAAYFAV